MIDISSVENKMRQQQTLKGRNVWMIELDIEVTYAMAKIYQIRHVS